MIIQHVNFKRYIQLERANCSCRSSNCAERPLPGRAHRVAAAANADPLLTVATGSSASEQSAPASSRDQLKW
jgi:hypothetical protein